MKKSVILLTVVTLFSVCLHAQNLVPNYSFEEQDTCPDVSDILLAPPWHSPTFGTPDLLNSSCSTQNLIAYDGIGCSGLYVLNPFTDNREYIQAPLTSTLVAGNTYCVSFYVRPIGYRYAVNRLGAHFSSVPIFNMFTTSVLPLTPQVENDPGTMLSSWGWTSIEGSFIASGGENYIIIGNFSNDQSTDTVILNSGSNTKSAYYLIDYIEVTACGSNQITDWYSLSQTINTYPNPAGDCINVDHSPKLNIKQAEFYDMTGRLINILPGVSNGANQYTIDTSGLSDGIYMLSLSSQFGLISRRIIIAR
jgi:hypothetical protein